MEYQEFKKILKEESDKININLEEEQYKKFYKYMNFLIKWNEKINLTAITDSREIILKHFIDSLTIIKYINKETKIIDVGTGAGFPGIPINIFEEKNKIEIKLLDSLNKRINFLNETIKELKLKNIYTIHGRAEEIAQNKKYREQYDVAVSRAVAPLNILVEYLLPFVKIGGICICMKGSNIEQEIEGIESVLDKLGGKIIKKEEFILSGDIKRSIIIIQKISKTNDIYPRKPGIPSKNPLK